MRPTNCFCCMTPHLLNVRSHFRPIYHFTQASNHRAWATSTRSRRARAFTTLCGYPHTALSAQVASWCPRMMSSWMSTQSFMGPLPSGAFGAGVGGCKRWISVGSTPSTSERPCPSSIACGEGMHTGMVLEARGQA